MSGQGNVQGAEGSSPQDRLAARFEASRAPLRALAFRMLGSASEAEDAVQEAWLRLSRADVRAVENLEGWLRTVVARVCLDVLRARAARREEPLEGSSDPDAGSPGPPAADARAGGLDPEQEAELADAVGLALLVVLDRLGPAERVAFVLHDVFALPFEEIAPIVGRSPAAARQLASRARRRVRGDRPRRAAGLRGAELDRKRAVVDAYLAASRAGDMAALLAVLDPDVVLRADPAALPPGAPAEVRGAPAVAGKALAYARRGRFSRAALVDGGVGIVVAPRGRLLAALGLTVAGDRVVAIDLYTDPERLARLDLAVLDDR
jgi:RNA polymerase sigma-70 factor (ECF subfamily)